MDEVHNIIYVVYRIMTKRDNFAQNKFFAARQNRVGHKTGQRFLLAYK